MPITFTCPGCDGQMRVADDLAGRKAKCSRCGTITQIPAKGGQKSESAVRRTPAPAPRPAAPPAGAANDFANLEEAPADRPAKRKKKGSSLIWVGLLGGGLLLSCCICSGIGVAVWFYFSSSGLPAEQKYLPDNAEVVVSFRVSELLDSKAYQRLRQEVPELDQMITSADNFPVAPANIDQMLVGVGSGSGDDSIIVIKTKNPITAQEILDKKSSRKMAGEPKGKDDHAPWTYREAKVSSYTLYENNSDAFCVPESRVLVAGDAKVVRKVLERNGKPTLSSGLETLVKEADFSKTVVVAANLRDPKMRKDLGREVPMPGFNAGDLFKDAEGNVTQIKVGSDIDVDVKLICKDAKSAEENRKLIDGVLVAFKKQAEAGGRGGDEIPREVIEIIDSIKVENKGANVLLTGQVKTDAVLKVAKTFQRMFR